MTITLTPENMDAVAEQAVATLHAGHLVIAPFDTVYGILCDPRDEAAIEHLVEVKNRPETKTLGVVVNNIDQVAAITHISTENQSQIRQMTPGRFTFILTAKSTENLSKQCLREGTIAVRIPSAELITVIAQKFGGPVAQTSANLSGHENCYDVAAVVSQLEQNLSDEDLIIDGGELEKLPPSEIWNMTGEIAFKIER
ncbi:MAG: L-threonylcarbamoyladenylate synthase [Candidatus Berkelbacteria bacterium]